MHNGWMWGEWNHMNPFMGIIMLIFWGLVIYAVLTLVRGARNTNQKTAGDQPRETPLEILKRRYAGGEIGKEEYERIKKDLE